MERMWNIQSSAMPIARGALLELQIFLNHTCSSSLAKIKSSHNT